MRWIAAIVSVCVVSVACQGCQRLTARAARAYENPPRGPARQVDTPAPDDLRDALADLPVLQRTMVDYALARLGTREPGLDCSRWVQRCYAAAGVEVPRDTRSQLAGGRRVNASQLEAGDLVFFAFRTRPVDHVGLYTGGGAFVHVSSAAGCVQLARLDAPEFAAAHIGSRRWIEPQPAGASTAVGGIP